MRSTRPKLLFDRVHGHRTNTRRPKRLDGALIGIGHQRFSAREIARLQKTYSERSPILEHAFFLEVTFDDRKYTIRLVALETKRVLAR